MEVKVFFKGKPSLTVTKALEVRKGQFGIDIIGELEDYFIPYEVLFFYCIKK